MLIQKSSDRKLKEGTVDRRQCQQPIDIPPNNAFRVDPMTELAIYRSGRLTFRLFQRVITSFIPHFGQLPG